MRLKAHSRLLLPSSSLFAEFEPKKGETLWTVKTIANTVEVTNKKKILEGFIKSWVLMVYL